MDIRTVQFNGMTFAFHDDEQAAKFASYFDTPEKAHALGAALELRKAKAENNQDDDGDGVCPHCFKCDGYLNVGSTHIFYCKEHKVGWIAGANLYSSWKRQTEEEQRRIYDEIGIDDFEDIDIEPFYWPPTVEELAEQERPIARFEGMAQ